MAPLKVLEDDASPTRSRVGSEPKDGSSPLSEIGPIAENLDLVCMKRKGELPLTGAVSLTRTRLL